MKISDRVATSRNKIFDLKALRSPSHKKALAEINALKKEVRAARDEVARLKAENTSQAADLKDVRRVKANTQTALANTQQKVWDLRRSLNQERWARKPIERALMRLKETSDIKAFFMATAESMLGQHEHRYVRSIGFALRDHFDAATGDLVLLHTATSMSLEIFAGQLCEHLSDADLAHYAIKGACFALSDFDDPAKTTRLAAIIDIFAENDGWQQSWHNFAAAMRASLAMKEIALYNKLRASAEAAGRLKELPAHKLVEFDRSAELLNLHLSGQSQPAKSDAISFGLISYSNIDYSSKNIGDYFQSVAVDRLIASFNFTGALSGDAADTLQFLSQTTREHCRIDHKVEKPVRFIEIGRDWTSLHANDPNRIWFISFGWHMHRQGLARYDFPPPDNFRPIFISVHIARPDMLTEDAVRFYKTYGPVGCRDWFTVRLMRSHGIEAFHSGCVTTLLGKFYRSKETSEPKVYADYTPTKRRPEAFEEYEPIDHDVPELIGMSHRERIEASDALLCRYEAVGEVATPLLHAYLPNQAMGNSVRFTNPMMADPRFEGLIGVPDDKIAAMAKAIETKLTGVLAKIFSGADEEEVYQHWRELCADDLEHAVSYLENDRHLANYNAYRDAPLSVDVLPRVVRNGRTIEAFDPDPAAAQFAFCFDADYLEYTIPTIRNLYDVTSGPIALHLFCRDLAPEALDNLSRAVPDATVVTYDMSGADYGDVNLLSHISISTMDRLMIPELIIGAKRVVYLDADIVLRGDARELYETDLKGNPIAARRSIHKEWRNGLSLVSTIANRLDGDLSREFRAELFASGTLDFPTFNAGVMVLDIEQLREDNFSNMLVSMVKKFHFHDQIAVNIYTRGRYQILDPKWNHYPWQEIVEDPKIVHYIGPTKPWHQPYQRYGEIWRDAARRVEGILSSSAPRIEAS